MSIPTSAAAHHPKETVAADKHSFSFTGTVASVDYASNIVDLVTDGRRIALVVEPTTAIDIAGQPGSESDIRPGVKLHVEGVVRDGTFLAQTITIHGSPKQKH